MSPPRRVQVQEARRVHPETPGEQSPHGEREAALRPLVQVRENTEKPSAFTGKISSLSVMNENQAVYRLSAGSGVQHCVLVCALRERATDLERACCPRRKGYHTEKGEVVSLAEYCGKTYHGRARDNSHPIACNCSAILRLAMLIDSLLRCGCVALSMATERNHVQRSDERRRSFEASWHSVAPPHHPS